MITIERTRDMVLIRNIMTHPKIYSKISDDGCPPAAEFQPAKDEMIIYALARDGSQPLGIWMLIPHNSVCWEIHTCLLPISYGERALKAAAAMLEWFWKHTDGNRLFTNVPSYNRLALRFAKKTGMKQFGVNEKSFLKDGKLYDQIMLGITKPEGEQPCQQP